MPIRILVVEDNHRLNSSLSSNVAHEGYSVDSAYDGQDLPEMTDYDLIILDIVVAEKGGIENQLCHDRQHYADAYKEALLQAHTSLPLNCLPRRRIER